MKINYTSEINNVKISTSKNAWNTITWELENVWKIICANCFPSKKSNKSNKIMFVIRSCVVGGTVYIHYIRICIEKIEPQLHPVPSAPVRIADGLRTLLLLLLFLYFLFVKVLGDILVYPGVFFFSSLQFISCWIFFA